MDDVSSVSAYEQGGTVLVEIVGHDEAGEIHVASYEFRPVESAEERIEPCRSLEEPHRFPIRDALTADGYQVTLG